MNFLWGWGKIVNITFNDPVYLWLFIGMFLVVLTHFVNLGWSRRKGISFANYELIERIARKKILPRSSFHFIIRFIILSLLILALADLVIWYEGLGINSDVVIAIDASASMLADDFDPSRLEAARATAIDLISRLDIATRVGVISFAGTSIINQPLTFDRIVLKDAIKGIDVIKTGGTAIGEAILLSANILSVSDGSGDRGRTLILITDGQSNVGIGPDDAISYANERGIIINTIGMATEEGGRFAGASAVSQLDTDILRKIADATEGRFYFAPSKEALEGAFLDIFSAEKRKIGINAKTHLLLIAVLLFFIEWILVNTRYRITP